MRSKVRELIFVPALLSNRNQMDGIVNKIQSLSHQHTRILVSIVGIPGSGKSTLAKQLSNTETVVVPMDGFHYSKAELAKFNDPAQALAQRGAPFTFNAEKLLDLLKRIKNNEEHEIMAPSFDHSIGDPVKDDISIKASHRVVIVEGLYLHLDEPVWRDIFRLFDARFWLEIDLEEALERVVERNFKAGISESRIESAERVKAVDKMNAQLVLAKSIRDGVEMIEQKDFKDKTQ